MTVIGLKTGAGKDVIAAGKFSNEDAALAAGFNAIVTNALEVTAYLRNAAFTLSAAVRLFNEHSPAKTVRFPDFEAAGKRLFKTLNDNLKENEMTPTNAASSGDAAATAPAAKAPKATPAAKAKKAVSKAAAADKTAKAATTAKKAAKKAATGAPGRTSKFTGMMLVAGPGLKKDADKSLINPRRAGTTGFTQLQWIIDATPKGGISYEDWTKKGGLPINLRHDEKETWVALKKKAA